LSTVTKVVAAENLDSPNVLGVVSGLDKPFLFAYLSWQDKVRTDGGVALVQGVDNRGGAGFNTELDLSAWSKGSPAMRVKIGGQNQMKSIRLMLADKEGKNGVWNFPLEGKPTGNKNIHGAKRQWLTPWDRIKGDPLLEFAADDPANFLIQSSKDPNFVQPVQPTAVHRKSRPLHWAQGSAEVASHHTLYLRLPKPFVSDNDYVIRFPKLNTETSESHLTWNSGKVRSDAVHVNQIGYRPDDPLKRAFVSCWLGTGGSMKLPESIRFAILEDASNKKVFEGTGEVHFPADRPELMAREVNFNGTDVARLDFSAFNTPGRYRIAVDGFGCSYPFDIGKDVWTNAFLIQMRGLYHNRTGIELGAPYTDFKKSRDMHPDDEYPVTQTSYRAVENGGEAWEKISGGDTGIKANGWGGYHDAGDWNPRRVSHMKVTMATLEVFDLFPKHFAALDLGIPKTEGLSADYRSSALKAFQFAEQDFTRDKSAGKVAGRDSTWNAVDDRNLAALELYRLTEEERFHQIFLEDTVLKEERPNLFQWSTHVHRDHAFHYARFPDHLGDKAMKAKAVKAIVDQAELELKYAEGNAFNLTTSDKGKPQFIGFYSTPDAADLVRAHYFTGEKRFLAGAVQSTQFQSGCNPNNFVYMTGIGANPLKNVFKLDARRTGQEVPAGLVPYGNIDFGKWNHQGITWLITWIIGKSMKPSAYEWPTHEAYWDLGGWPMLEEFTVDAWTPNILVWGYLSAR